MQAHQGTGWEDVCPGRVGQRGLHAPDRPGCGLRRSRSAAGQDTGGTEEDGRTPCAGRRRGAGLIAAYCTSVSCGLLIVLIPDGANGSSTTNAVKNRNPVNSGKPPKEILPGAMPSWSRKPT